MSPWSDITEVTLCIYSYVQSSVLKSCQRGGQLFKGTEETQKFNDPMKSKGSCPESPGWLIPEKFSSIPISVLSVGLCNGV